MDKDLKGRDIKTLINVFAEGCIEDHPSLPFEHYKKVHIGMEYYPHAVELKNLLISNGFEVSEITSDMWGYGPGMCNRVGHDMELECKTLEDRDKLRELLDSGIYNLTFE